MELPAGFQAVTYFEESGVYPEYTDRAKANDLIFDITNGFPLLPLVAKGLFWHSKGMSASICWAIDSNRQVWGGEAAPLQKMDLDTFMALGSVFVDLIKQTLGVV